MFAFLSLLSIAQCLLGLILFIAPDVSNIIAIVVLISGIMGAVAYGKLETIETRTKWLTEIAKSKGYKDPTENPKN